MSRCPTCGGVLGRDCFNPIECAQISDRDNAYYLHVAEKKIAILISVLIENGIEVPDLESQAPEQILTSNLDNSNDYLPF